MELKEEIASLRAEIRVLKTQPQNLELILKYVVVPLISIVGALIGLKLWTEVD